MAPHPGAEVTPSGPYDHWPTHQGFDYYYGFLNGETNQWYPELTLGTQPVEMVAPPGRKGDYTLNEDLADKAISWIKAEKSLAPDKPFFIYYAPGASHAPLQAPKAWIDKFKGQFDMGWDRYREIVFERQKKLGVVPQDTKLTPRPSAIPAWDSLTPDQQKVAARLMEVFAGFTAQNDHEFGRVIDAIAATGQLDNTLIIYIAGDNGASIEGGLYGTFNYMAQINGVPETLPTSLLALDRVGGPTTSRTTPSAGPGPVTRPFNGASASPRISAERAIPWSYSGPHASRMPAAFALSSKTSPMSRPPSSMLPPSQSRLGGRRKAAARGWHQLSLHLRFALSSTQAHHPVFRDARQSRHLPRWLDRRSPQRPFALDILHYPETMIQQPWELYHLYSDFSEADNLAR